MIGPDPMVKQENQTGSGGRSSFASAQRDTRILRAEKILALLRDHCGPARCDALDIGTGAGIIARRLAEEFKSLTSVDVIDQRTERGGFRFLQVPNERLPFPDDAFDVVISNQVIEHVWQPRLHLREMARVLKPQGIGYLATPNRYALMEPHYRLPLLAWFPAPLAARYLRLVKAKTWDINAHSFHRLRRMVEEHFEWEDALFQVGRRPVHYRLMRSGWKSKLVARLPRLCWDSRYNLLLPSFILILRRAER